MTPIQVELTPDEYEDELNDEYGTVSICDCLYKAGTALRAADPVAFALRLSIDNKQWTCPVCGNRWVIYEWAEECCDDSNLDPCADCEDIEEKACYLGKVCNKFRRK